MTENPSVERLAEGVRRRLQESTRPLNAYWVQAAGNRDEYAKALGDEFQGEPVVVEIIRDGRFANPNAILADLVDLVGGCREKCELRLSRSDEKCAFVLLSRSELAIPQVASPILLPVWFPVGGGTTVWSVIEDVTWSVDAPLGAVEARIGNVCERLLTLEDALVTRMLEVRRDDQDRRKTMGFFDVVRRESETFDDLLTGSVEYRASVTTASAFRPSRRDGRAIVARLWGVVLEKAPEGIGGPSKALVKALDLADGIGEQVWHESMASVLGRPAAGETPKEERFCRNIYLSVGAACQLITAAAHADAYGRYPVTLLRAVSFDLRRSLSDAEGVLRSLLGE